MTDAGPLRIITLGALRKEWLRALPASAGWIHFNEGNDAGSILFKAGRRNAHCPSCGASYPNTPGQFVICCGLRIHPPWLVREFRFDPQRLPLDVLEQLHAAAKRNARCSGGQVTIEPPPREDDESC